MIYHQNFSTVLREFARVTVMSYRDKNKSVIGESHTVSGLVDGDTALTAQFHQAECHVR